ncbi:carbohydrate ABC transporter permease [Anaerocolumna chitinilytica]|jgi:raffinose/stachyose/melibiose transport system permease protein|uniref:Sugar ABC transporter permease n=1 Tax=Anaerocolumna chitinilytica TaxID=1727145 RepID=A0A7I8DUL2_9FIRM|nr:carbohydrate ABC transporter permease [Anaerocolumna chitinilytica]BCK01065.1 sugar ABC transporter permease [Anaerocolumna chitinilytica]
MKFGDNFLDQNKKSRPQSESFQKNGIKGKEIWVYIVFGIWALINLFPVYWMFTFSLKSNEEIFGKNVAGLPKEWLWSNYEKAMSVGHIGKYFLNSTIIAVVTIAIVMLFSLMATFALTRFIWKGRKQMNAFFMLGLTIPIHAAIVPIYVTLSKLHLLNTYLALIIPYAAFSLAMGILICTGFMQELPIDLDEAACIDGCNTWGIFFRIIVPLMKPAVATVSIYTFLQCWNELMFANIFISDSVHKTLPVGVQALSGQYTTDWGPIGAALVLATFPTLIFYIFFSKKIQDSFIAGAIKG